MKQLKEYENLYRLYRESIRPIKTLICICLAVFILGLATMFFYFVPFGLTMFMLLFIIPAVILGCVLPIASIRTKQLFKTCSPSWLAQVDAHVKQAEKCGGLYVTREALVDTRLGVCVVPMEDLLWVYLDVTEHYYWHFIKIGTTCQLVLADKHGKKRYVGLKKGKKTYPLIEAEMRKYHQNIIFGYEAGLDKIYETNRGRMIAFAEGTEEYAQR